jgi:hypothetical protein
MSGGGVRAWRLGIELGAQAAQKERAGTVRLKAAKEFELASRLLRLRRKCRIIHRHIKGGKLLVANP